MLRRRVRRTRRVSFFVLLASIGALWVFPRGPAAQTASPPKPKGVDFNRDIRPILSDNCFTCHGPNEESRQANLRLDIKEGGAFDQREGYRVIVPGASAESRLYQKISAKDEALRMPPVISGRNLTAKQIELI